MPINIPCGRCINLWPLAKIGEMFPTFQKIYLTHKFSEEIKNGASKRTLVRGLQVIL